MFGHRVPTGVHAGWNVDPLTGSAWPLNEKWWRIDIRSSERLSDVKWVWEAGRHRDLVILARAAVLEPDAVWLSELEAMLEGWLEQCPPERGVNWYSSLELALRAIAWAQVLELVGERLDPLIRAGMEAQLVASARHIMLELPYTVSSMKNNHLLGDGLGLVVLGRLFPAHPAAQRWRRVGDALFLKQLKRHMRSDGSMIEDSLSYHRFVLEMLTARVLLGEAPGGVAEAMEAAAENLRQLGALDGPVPQFGDWDEGRVLADSAPAGSVSGSCRAGLALAGYEIEPLAWDDHDEVAWYVAPDVRRGRELQPLARARTGGYFQVVECPPWKVWFKHVTGPSHQHADLTAIWVLKGGDWIIEDPGTGTYNGPLEVRNGLRTSSAHPVWRPADADQLVPHRAFRWLQSPRLHSSEPLQTEAGTYLFAWHDAFVETHGRVGRLVRISQDGIAVHDFVERPSNGRLTLPLGPSAEVTSIVGMDGADVVAGKAHPFEGWRSETYGVWTPSTWLTAVVDGSEVAWGIGAPTDEKPAVTWGTDMVSVTVSSGDLVASRG
ncbi:MAG TPA: heparinase II/III family protein [Marmoricola sp.]|nr:heparinase II/III family protein [Marmoricola sp.]